MKKIFTFLAASIMVMGSYAQTSLSLGAGWDTTLDDVTLTGDVEFNYKNSYASVEMDITEVDLSVYPSYEIEISSDSPAESLQLNVVSDLGEAWSGAFSAGTTKISFIPEGASKLTKIALQACNVENLGKVEIVSANLIDANGNKTPMSYKVPASWAADVITPITSATIKFTSGGQWTFANINGASGLINQRITIKAESFPANVQIKVTTNVRSDDNTAIYQPLTEGGSVCTFDVLKTEEGEEITAIYIQNSEEQDPFNIKVFSVIATPIIEIYDGGWASLVSANALDFTDTGLTVYAVTSANSTSATLEDVGLIVPANVGVLINGEPGTYAIPYGDASNVSVTSILAGSATEASTVEESSAYVLSKEDDLFHLYTGTTIPAGKAYLPVSALSDGANGAKALNLVFEEATGISNIQNETLNNGEIYNLNGVRVSNPTMKGIYIQNGKKYIVK